MPCRRSPVLRLTSNQVARGWVPTRRSHQLSRAHRPPRRFERVRNHTVIEAAHDDAPQPSSGTAQREALHRRADLDVHVAASPAVGRLVDEMPDQGVDIGAEGDRHGRGRYPRLLPERCGGQRGADVARPSRHQAAILRRPGPRACGSRPSNDDEA